MSEQGVVPVRHGYEPHQPDSNSEAAIDLREIPVKALNYACRGKLSLSLNQETLIDKDGYNRDYRGLAERLGFEPDHISAFMRDNNPTMKMLSNWEYEAGSTIGILFEHLEFLERYDIIDDIRPLAERNAREYLARQPAIEPAQALLQVNDEAVQQLQVPDNPNHLTLGDLTGPEREYFHAYVCHADENIDFVLHMANRLESNGIKVCLKDRDVIPARFEYESLVSIIENRCTKMLVICSPEFVRSSECEFLTKFATGLSIRNRQHKIIPVLYKCLGNHSLPSSIKFLSKVDFTRPKLLEWSWNRLVLSMRPTSPHQPLSPPPYRTQENPLPINYQVNSEEQSSANDFESVSGPIVQSLTPSICSTPRPSSAADSVPIVQSPTLSLSSTQMSSSSVVSNSDTEILQLPSPPASDVCNSSAKTLELPSPPASVSISKSSTLSVTKSKHSNRVNRFIQSAIKSLNPSSHFNKKQHS